MVIYKVAELSIVTDETLEETLNAWVRQGWAFESLHFAMNPGSKRPAMAFLFFTRQIETHQDAVH
jgi:hypothetical protein